MAGLLKEVGQCRVLPPEEWAAECHTQHGVLRVEGLGLRVEG